MKLNIITKILLRIRFLNLLLTAKFLGISCIIRYLRNPHPYLTSKILKHYGATIGKGTTIKRSIYLDNVYEDQDSKGDFTNLVVGNNCYIGDNVYFDLANLVLLKDNCIISGEVSFITHADCNRSLELSRVFPRQCAPIIIENDCWIGFSSKLLSGSKMQQYSVLASCSLLNSTTDEFSVFAGTPASFKKKI